MFSGERPANDVRFAPYPTPIQRTSGRGQSTPRSPSRLGQIVGGLPPRSPSRSVRENGMGRSFSQPNLGLFNNGYGQPGGDERTFGRDVSNYGMDHSSAGAPGHQILQHVTSLASYLQLEDSMVQDAQEFSQLPPATQGISTFMMVLAVMKAVDKLSSSVSELNVKVNSIEEVTCATWTLSKAQELSLTQLLRHHMVRFAFSFGKSIILSAMDHIAKHRAAYHLERFQSDEVIKNTVLMFLFGKLNSVKSAYRKCLFKHVKARLALDDLAAALVDRFHLSPKPEQIKSEMLALIALQRSIAQPLANVKNPKGGDTGFWRSLNAALTKLSQEHGKDRKSDGWVNWRTIIIQTDRAKYKPEAASNVMDDPDDDDDDLVFSSHDFNMDSDVLDDSIPGPSTVQAAASGPANTTAATVGTGHVAGGATPAGDGEQMVAEGAVENAASMSDTQAAPTGI